MGFIPTLTMWCSSEKCGIHAEIPLNIYETAEEIKCPICESEMFSKPQTKKEEVKC